MIVDNLEFHTILQHDPPTHDRRAKTERKKTKGSFAQDHAGYTKRKAYDDMTEKTGN